MAIGKQHKLVLVPTLKEASCEGCWYYGRPHLDTLPCPTSAYDNLSCLDGNNDSIWELQPVKEK
jgi:hypothetical protein